MNTVTYIVSDIDKALAFEWVADHLDREKFALDFILLNRGDSALERHLRSRQVPVKRLYLHRGRNMIFTLIPLWWTLLIRRPDIIHTHLRYASLLGLAAGKWAGVKRRILTRHHSTSNHLYHPHAVKTDRWMTRHSTTVVAISEVVRQTLIEREHAPPEKIVQIPHGFDLDYFRTVDPRRVAELRRKYIPHIKGPVVGVISRYLELKGHRYVVEAFGKLLDLYPDAHLVLANATGPDDALVAEALSALPPASYTEIKFEPDLAALYRLFDVFVHVPIADHVEAFGQTYVEALASSVPSVFTRSGIANEFIHHERNALVVDFKNSEEIYEAGCRILREPELKSRLIEQGQKDVQKFSLDTFIARLETLYQNG